MTFQRADTSEWGSPLPRGDGVAEGGHADPPPARAASCIVTVPTGPGRSALSSRARARGTSAYTLGAAVCVLAGPYASTRDAVNRSPAPGARLARRGLL